MSVNRVTPETAEQNRNRGGAYTFNSFPDDDYVGPVLLIAALRLGDHAHLEVGNGYQRINTLGDAQINYGLAGHLVMSWEAWVYWRDQLSVLPGARIAEVENPTRGQLDRHLPRGNSIIREENAT